MRVLHVLIAVTLTYGSARAQSQAERAAAADRAGQEAFAAQHYAAATEKFREAIARDPQAIYLFHACGSLYPQGRFGEAITACEAALKLHPADELVPQIEALLRRIRDEVARQHVPKQI